MTFAYIIFRKNEMTFKVCKNATYLPMNCYFNQCIDKFYSIKLFYTFFNRNIVIFLFRKKLRLDVLQFCF